MVLARTLRTYLHPIVSRYDTKNTVVFEFPQADPYVGEDAAGHMLTFLVNSANKIHDKLFPPPALHMTALDTARYESEDSCHLCVQKYKGLCHIQHQPDADVAIFMIAKQTQS